MKEEFPKNENVKSQLENLSDFDLSKSLEIGRTIYFDLGKINEYVKTLTSEQDEMTEHFANTEYQDIFKREDIYGEKSKGGLPVHLVKEKIDLKISELNKNLEKVGIAFEKSNNNNERGEELDPYVSNGEKFLEYLKSIHEDKITATQKESLQEFLEQLRTQIFDAYHENEERLNHFLNILPHMKGIVDNAKRLKLTIKDPVGLEYNLTDISDAIEPIQKHYLREFAISRRSYLYARIIGPMWWHNNKNATEYKEILESILEDIEKINENPKASPLYEKMKDDFIGTLEKLHKVIKDRPPEWEKMNKNSELLPIIEEFQQKTERLSGSG